jgi:6-phosphofructokinase 1
MKKIAILSSGGDAPAMNAAIRSVVRTAIFHNIEVVGFYRGYQGLIENDFVQLDMSAVGRVMSQGGTFLKTARSKDFFLAEKRKQAYENLISLGVDALVVLGGNGSMKGAKLLEQEFKLPVVAMPGSIDNDVFGSDLSIGFQTAVQTIVDAVDKIKDTARSHDRLFFVEVMGRDCGQLAMHAAIASGACFAIVPEKPFRIEDLANRLADGKRRGKTSSVVIVTEGNAYGSATKIAADFQSLYPEYETKVTILGHLQRGGTPVYGDRLLASQMGYAAVQALINEDFGKTVVSSQGQVQLADIIDAPQPLSEALFEMNRVISK